ncbi:MAG: hypothetical protein H8D24_08000 [Gammaproteobacteria bacterium]|uniref:Uncharacterized protein n=1 Tax=Candidatus Thiopontia autotrophica TaxID=2841688 RepID=A0A8J6PBU6_9GAMM|nr:hypothetical protein [Candidatus Thiopontia autotrophica]MBL6969192.1 hypothetical protein [Gammaproteobacteria bacterium]
MAFMRIAHKWHKDDKHEISELAGSLSYNCWKFSLKMVRNLQDEKFYFTSKSQGLEVMTEMLIFLIQITDRLVYDSMEPDIRGQFIGAMAYRLLDIVEDNYADLPEQGPDRTDLVGLINERAADYAEFSFGDDGPSYHFIRYFGERVGAIMGDDQDNRWVIDQIMEIEVPDAIEALKKSIEGIVGVELN